MQERAGSQIGLDEAEGRVDRGGGLDLRAATKRGEGGEEGGGAVRMRGHGGG